jgi:hypothetical protein
MTAPANSRWDSEVRFLALLATSAAVCAFLFYFRRGEVLLYGDAVAHLNLARRVFDSKTPGLLQLGTVWLPLPHLLMIPFLISDEMWQRGAGGSIPSLLAYVFGVVGMFQLVRGALTRDAESNAPARVAAWAAALVYAANPNLLYLQTTAMGEGLYLAFFIWAVVYFGESVCGDAKALTKCGLCLAAACLTRYDGWFLSVAMAATVVVFSILASKGPGNDRFGFRPSRAAAAKFVLLAAAAPALWLAYNAIVYRNPLEFENGPYSAKAIERKTQNAGNPGHPGGGNPILAGQYFLKSAEANVAENEWLQRAWVLLVLVAIAATLFVNRLQKTTEVRTVLWLPLLFLLIPVPFYALSVAYGGVPIFVPPWWPFSHYNVRYGLQLLPAFATALAILVCLAMRFEWRNPKLRPASVLLLFAFVVASCASIWRAGPQSLQEAEINMRTRNLLEAQLASLLKGLPPNATLLMYLGDHVGAVQQAGIHLNRVINEGNHRVWKQPVDPEGLWERALADPAQYADYVVASEGDVVWQAAQARHLRELVEIHVSGQSRAILYRAR